MQLWPVESGGARERHDVILNSKGGVTQVSAQAFIFVVGHHLELNINHNHA